MHIRQTDLRCHRQDSGGSNVVFQDDHLVKSHDLNRNDTDQRIKNVNKEKTKPRRFGFQKLYDDLYKKMPPEHFFEKTVKL